MENSRTFEICIVNLHRSSYVKHLRSKKHLENEKQNQLTIPKWLIKGEQTPIKKELKKIYNRKTPKHIARKIFLKE